MFFWIPGQTIACITFPGVIIHEIAHRFFCDIFNVPVYEINYFKPFSKTAGHVRHHPTNSLRAAFFIGMAPLFINSILCMVLTLPMGIPIFLGTNFLMPTSLAHLMFGLVLYWVGMSIGFNAIPSKQDLAGLWYMTDSRIIKMFLMFVYILLWPFNINGIGPLCCLIYAYLLSMLLPFILLG